MFVLCLFSLSPTLHASSGLVRVLIIDRHQGSLSFDCDNIRLVSLDRSLTPDGDFSFKNSDRSITISANNDKVVHNNRDFHALLLSSEIKNGITIKKSVYHGEMIVLAKAGNLSVINTIPLNLYLEGVLSKEIIPNWPIETIKAQAIISRTFALKRIEQARTKKAEFDLKASVIDQVYGGKSDHERIRQAVDMTKDQILSYQNKLIEAFFHSCCGGVTEVPNNVWRDELEYYTPVQCSYCTDAVDYFWEYRISRSQLKEKLGQQYPEFNNLYDISIAERDPSNRNKSIKIKYSFKRGLTIPGDTFRRLLGYNSLKSTWFKIISDEEKISFLGSGSGHGVGLCQWGAKKMGILGKTSEEILSYYYPRVKITRRTLLN